MGARDVLARLGRAQFGLITRQQALAAGLSTGQIRRRVRSGEWVVIRPTVYAVAGAPPSWCQAVLAVALAAGPDAWASGETAAALWGFPGASPEAIDVVTPLGRRVRMDGVREHRSSALFTADLARHRGIPVTTPARTLVDISPHFPTARLGAILDDALRRRLIRLDGLRRCVGRLDAAPGRHPAKVRRLLAERLPGYDPGDSDLETRVLRLLVGAGLPVPVQQYGVRIGGRTFRLDLGYPDLKLAIELDGWDFHRTRTAFDHDRDRANALVIAGWALVRFTSRTSDTEIVACVQSARALFGQSGVA
jgi:hypothetical protein